jgi:hypothetical protein
VTRYATASSPAIANTASKPGIPAAAVVVAFPVAVIVFVAFAVAVIVFVAFAVAAGCIVCANTGVIATVIKSNAAILKMAALLFIFYLLPF